MKMIYVTRVKVPGSSAQSIQILSTANALVKQVSSFRLYSRVDGSNQNENNWHEKIRIPAFGAKITSLLYTIYVYFKEKPDCVFTRDIAIACIFLAFRCHVIYESHKPPMNRIAQYLFKKFIRHNMSNLIVISEGLREYYVRKYPKFIRKMVLQPSVVNVYKYNLALKQDKKILKKELALDNDKKLVMYTGSLYKGKDFDQFCDAAKLFPEYNFVCIGGTGDEISKYKVKYAGINNIQYVGHVDNSLIANYQVCADILFYPLSKENPIIEYTSPLKAYEYMAAKVPIVSSDLGGGGFPLNDGNCYLYSPGDYNTVYRAIVSVFALKNMTKEKVEKAYSMVRDEFNYDRKAKNIIRLCSNEN